MIGERPAIEAQVHEQRTTSVNFTADAVSSIATSALWLGRADVVRRDLDAGDDKQHEADLRVFDDAGMMFGVRLGGDLILGMIGSPRCHL